MRLIVMCTMLVACGDKHVRVDAALIDGQPIDAPIDARPSCSSPSQCMPDKFCCILCSPGGACIPAFCTSSPSSCSHSLCDGHGDPCTMPFGGAGTCQETRVSVFDPTLVWACKP